MVNYKTRFLIYFKMDNLITIMNVCMYEIIIIPTLITEPVQEF